MNDSLDQRLLEKINSDLKSANMVFNKNYPGDLPARQPIHTVYGGAQIFTADTAQKLGKVALRSLKEYAPTPSAFSKALHLKVNTKLQKTLYTRVVEKLEREPVEDFRIDFEDGYGNRPNDEEDGHAVSTAEETARAMNDGTLPPFFGIRIKPFTEELKARSIRTLDIFISTVLERTGGTLPNNFVVTLPKVVVPEHVSALVELFKHLEAKHSLKDGSLKLEIMIETPQSIINNHGESALPHIVAAAEGRCVAAHFGVYDYTASLNVTAAHQTMDHPACDFARHMMQVALAGTGIWISDGAT
ncbi:MAG: phosphoenolpyruvate kinase, partial [Ignavibacteria bacterium]|nr:phosphoenolpyruvate kinase [Ignavibacteria bacterium]